LALFAWPQKRASSFLLSDFAPVADSTKQAGQFAGESAGSKPLKLTTDFP
jgi:hypothetical protein